MSAAIDQAAQLVSDIGNSDFAGLYAAACQKIFDNDQCTVFRFSDQSAPVCLIADARIEETRQITRLLADEYATSAYRRDPTLRRARQSVNGSGKTHIQSVAASDIRDDVYRARFYEEGLVRQKIAIVSYVRGQILYSSFYRNPDQRDFSQSDLDALGEVGPLLCRILAKHFEDTQEAQDIAPHPQKLTQAFRERLQEKVKLALLSERHGLTPREAEICAAIALGYTNEAIGLLYSISSNTVATHRKRAYSKLNISSQSELFARYIEFLVSTPS